MTEEEFFAFAKQVEADLVAHDPTWAEAPFGTEAGLLEQYSQTFDGVGTIFYYVVSTNPTDGTKFRGTMLLDMARDESPDPGDGIDELPEVVPPEASDLVWYGHNPPETPALSPIWFDTQTGDIRIWYSFNGDETWINTGVAGVGKIEFLNDLQDVDVLTTPPADNDFLKFSLADNKWLPYDMNSYNALTYAAIDHTHDSLSEILDVDVTTEAPSNNDKLLWDGSQGKWVPSSSSAITTSEQLVWYSDTAPTNPVNYPIWFNTSTSQTLIYYNDGTSTQWINVAAAYTPPQKTIFQATMSADATGLSSGWLKVPFNTISDDTFSFDTESGFNTSTNQYVIPETGYYFFHMALRVDNVGGAYDTQFAVDGTRINQGMYAYRSGSSGLDQSVHASVMMSLTQGQSVSCYINTADTSWEIKSDSLFGGYRI